MKYVIGFREHLYPYRDVFNKCVILTSSYDDAITRTIIKVPKNKMSYRILQSHLDTNENFIPTLICLVTKK